ncbi:MAG: TonB-dependent receptor, partial [Pseudomonadota bacterium]|nr:TonB-dependent receptor [Pseudomonadota bacterium]
MFVPNRRPLPFHRTALASAMLGLVACSGSAAAQEDKSVQSVVVEASRNSQLGIAGSANEGVVTQKQLEARTVYRPGEMLEATPGLVVSQHSGEGKANQFYLRGFNLDHGTDLRTEVDGMIVNKRSHSHGQGWTDLNFMIPELVTRLDYRKGPYYAEVGDFGSAGAVNVRYADQLPNGLANLSVGGKGYRRALLANSSVVGTGNLLYALELFHNDGPFSIGDDYRKINGVLRYSDGNSSNGYNVTAMGYHGSWHSTDQIPQRAVDAGTLGRFDAFDPTDGGSAHRYSVSGEWHRASDSDATKVNVYAIDDRLNLFSNFTYFLDDPINGDQFNQPDHRITTGVNAVQTWNSKWMGRDAQNRVGVQFQNDNIQNGLYSTLAQQRLSTTREDHVTESSIGLFVENSTRWTDKFRTIAGLREDAFRVDLNSHQTPANSGSAHANKLSPKLNLIFGPWD